jgi:hypothetical protein
MALPTTTDEWILESASENDFLLHVDKSVPLPAVGGDDVLLEIKAVSLNYRDLAIARVIHTSSPSQSLYLFFIPLQHSNPYKLGTLKPY